METGWLICLLLFITVLLWLLGFSPWLLVLAAPAVGVWLCCVHKRNVEYQRILNSRSTELNEKKNKIEWLKNRRDELQGNLKLQTAAIPEDLVKKRKKLLNKGSLEGMKTSYTAVVQCLLEIIELHCKNYVELANCKEVGSEPIPSRINFVSEVELSQDEQSQKKKYSMYGLLLNACIKNVPHSDIKKKMSKLTVVTMSKIQDEYKFAEGVEGVSDFVKESIQLTYTMLTLLPPLVLTKPQWQDDDVQDTNRLTWNETSSQPLIYYRPVVVYGNQLHVAVKGLVGNTATRDKSTVPKDN